MDVKNNKHHVELNGLLDSNTESQSRNQVKVRGEVYTQQDCIEDIQSIANEFPDRRISRDFYRQEANIPEAAWVNLFGTFAEFLRAASINPSRYQNKISLETAKHASLDKLREWSDERKDYGSLYLKPNNKRFQTLIATSDWHDEEIDPFFFRVLLDTIKRVSPDVVCLAGDIFDLAGFSSYNQDPREYTITERINFGNDLIRQVREAAPNSQMDLIEGNHEARLLKHIRECTPQIQTLLSDMHGNTIKSLLKLDQHEINYYASADLTSFTDAQLKKDVYDKNTKVYWNCLLAHHFPDGKNRGMPGFNGHHHKHVVWSEHNLVFGSYEWHQLGAGHRRTASYCDGEIWNNGFAIISVDTLYGYNHFDYVTVGPTFALSGGQYYMREPEEVYPSLQVEFDTRPFRGRI